MVVWLLSGAPPVHGRTTAATAVDAEAHSAARELLAHAESIGPGDADAFAAAASALAGAGPFPAALDPEDAANHVAHGLQRLGRSHAALRFLVEFEQQQPAFAFGAGYQRLLAQLAWEHGDLESAARAVQRGLARREPADDYELALLRDVQATLEASVGHVAAAGRHVDEAIAAADRARDDECRTMVAFAHCNVCLLAEDYEQAAAALANARPGPKRSLHEAIVRLGRDDGAQAHAALDALFVQPGLSPGQRALAAAKAVQKLLQRGDVAAAAARYETLLELVPIDAKGTDGRSAALGIELALRGRACVAPATLLSATRAVFEAMLAARGSGSQGDGAFLHLDDRCTLLANLVRFEEHLAPGGEGARRALEHVLAVHAASLPAATMAAPELTSRLLGPGHGLLVFVPGRFATALLCVHADGDVEVFPLPAAGVLRPRIDAMHRAVDSVVRDGSGVAELDRQAHDLAALLLPPAVAARLATWQRLSISGAGLLQNLRFELLPVARAGGEQAPLGRALPVDYPANLLRSARAEPARQQGAVVFAASLLTEAAGHVAERFPSPLAAACCEPHRQCAGAVPVQLLDEAATPAEVRAALLDARIVHVVGHGLRDVEGERAYGIALSRGVSDDGLLWGDTVVELDLRGLLVLLSGCRAGRTLAQRSNDPLRPSLAGCLLAAGARAVLVPTTDVALGDHLDAMARVHEALVGGKPLAVALHAARSAPAANARAGLELLLVQVHGCGY